MAEAAGTDVVTHVHGSQEGEDWFFANTPLTTLSACALARSAAPQASRKRLFIPDSHEVASKVKNLVSHFALRRQQSYEINAQ